MTDAELVRPWYKRDLLPSWVPGWLVACVLIGLGFAVSFGLLLGDENPWGAAAVAGAIGFGFGLMILSWASATTRATPDGHRLTPPEAIRWPIVTALLCLVPFFWMTEGRIGMSISRGGRTVLEGVAVEIIALTALVLIAAGVGWRVRETWRRDRRLAAAEVLSLVVALSVAGYAVVIIVKRHFV
jgi:hypothetical protein